MLNLAFSQLVTPQWDRSTKKSWFFKTAPLLVLGAESNKTAPNLKLGVWDWRPSCLNFKIQREWECSALKAVTPVDDDEIPSSPDVLEQPTEITLPTRFHKDLSYLPKPLSATMVSSVGGTTNVRVAYQGIPGAYSEAAALKAFPESETVQCDEYEAVFKAVDLWLVDKAVLPIENNVGGSIHRNYDLLLRHRLFIVGEIQLIVNHCLLGLPGVKKEDLKHVVSHPQALEQCGKILNKLGVTRISAVDTAVAAQVVKNEGVRETGAIASVRAAAIYGLDVLDEGIQDDSYNVTRYLILAREPIIPGTEGSYKTSIVFSLGEEPGVLFKALAVFAMRDINLSKIESRPQKRQPLRVVEDSNNAGAATYFEYIFYIDFEASMADPRAQFALGHLQEFAKFIRILGSFPNGIIYK